jgi:hypothetical protein
MRPDTRAFLERVRDAENPSRTDEERVLRALQGSLAAGFGATALGATALAQSGLGKTWIAKTAAALGSFGSKLSLVAALSAAALGGGDSARSASAPVRIVPVDSSVVRLARFAPAQKLEEQPVHEPARSLPREPEKRPERAPAARERRAAPLRAELALLREVQSALRSGDGAAALRALDAHRGGDRRLLAERQAARILALCQVGRIAEARRAALEFANNHPGSVQGAAIANSCASAQRIRSP